MFQKVDVITVGSGDVYASENMLMMMTISYGNLFKSDNKLISLVLSALVAEHSVEGGPG